MWSKLARMRVLLLGASGMVGQGVLLECLRSGDVSEVVAPVRQRMEQHHSKLVQVQHPDFFQWTDFDLSGFDACFFPLGVSAVGMSEAAYRHTTFDLTLSLANALLAASPQAVFVYVSGAGTNAHGRAMWARVKGETENALLALPFRAVYCFRPGYIQPLDGIRSKVAWYQRLYDIARWAYPLLRRFPALVTSTQEVGLAMLQVALNGWHQPVLESAAINDAAAHRRLEEQNKAPRQ